MRAEFFVTQLACCDNLTGLYIFAVTGIDNHFLTPDAIVLFHELTLVDNLLLKEASVTRIEDVDLAHHLTHDYFKVLVVDLHTLHTVYILNLVDDIFLNGSGTHDVEDVGRSDGTVGERSSGAHIVVFLNENLLRQRNEILLDFAKLGSNRYLTVASLNLAKLNLTVDFRNDSGVGRVTCLKELGNTGQTTGDITGITCRTRNLDEYLAGATSAPFSTMR